MGRREYDLDKYGDARKKRGKVSAVLICIVIPAIIALSCLYLDSSKYMIVSLLVLIATMLPFFMVFEKRRPKAREIVLIAMMSALTIVTQLVFHITIPIQAGTALVIVSGISLGPEAGFLIGAISRFVLNFYGGQGPWTPWEMFCWGLMGFLAGLVFNKVDLDSIKSRNFKVILGPVLCVFFAILVAYGVFMFFPGEDNSFIGWRLYIYGAVGLIFGVLVQRKRLPVDNITITAFTFLVTFIIYGGIMNVCAMVTSAGIPGNNPISWDTMRVLYISGAPYDAAHAGTAALFIFLFGNSIIRKLERIKIKYGIYR